MRMRKANVILGFISIAIAVWFLIGAQQFPKANGTGVGPGTFPTSIAILVIIFSVSVILNSLFKKTKDSRIEIKRLTNIILSIVAILLFVYAIPNLGFYISAAIFFPILLFLASETNWKSIVATTILFELFAFGVFDSLLGVPLP